MPLRTIAALLLSTLIARAELTIDAGVTEVPFGQASATIPVVVVGGDLSSDLTAAIQIDGVDITGVSYAGSIWESASGGFIDFFIDYPPSGSTVDPNLSLLTANETVAGTGILLSFTVDTSALPAGEYPIKLTLTDAGDTAVFSTGGAPIAANILNGTLSIVDKPLILWRASNFPADVGNSSLESTVWGDLADPDGDEIANLLEFAFELPPNSPELPETEVSSPGVPTIIAVEDSGMTYLAVRYTRRLDTSCHSVVVETSSDLINWDPSGINLTAIGSPVPHSNGLTETVTERYTTPMNSRQFLRVVVTNLAP